MRLLLTMMAVLTAMGLYGEDARFKGLVTFAGEDFIVVARDDKADYGGQLVRLHDANGKPSEGPGKFRVGDKIRVSGAWHGEGPAREVLASGIVKRGAERRLKPAPLPKSADIRRGLLHLYRVRLEGELKSIEKASGLDGEALTYLGIAYEHTIHSVCVHGDLPAGRFAPGMTASATGVVFNRFAADGTALSAQIEVSNLDDVIVTAGGAMAALRTAVTALAVFFSLATLVLLAAWLRARRERLRFEAIAEERRRIAGELHDTVEQYFAGAKILITGAQSIPGLPPEALSLLSQAASVMANAKLEVRDAILDLRAESSPDETLAASLRRLAQSINAAQAVKVRVFLRSPGALQTSTGVRKDIIAIAREAITNAVKHGKAKRVIILAEPQGEKGGFLLQILNDGESFDAASALGPETGHFGLSGMRERALRSDLALRFSSRGIWCGIELAANKGPSQASKP